MKKSLQNIANILTLNIDNIESNGLLDGKMGIVIFYYNYGTITQNAFYINLADELFDSIFESLSKVSSKSFDSGLLGIAWGIRYLIRNKFVDGNPEEILSDVDLGFKNYINDLNSKVPLTTIGLYLHALLLDKTDTEKENQLINIVLQKYEFYFLCLTIQFKSIAYINSVLFVLSFIEKKVEFSQRIERIMFKVLSHINQIPLENINKINRRTLYQILLSVNVSFNEKNEILKKIETLNHLHYSNEESMEYLWQHFIYFSDKYFEIDINDIYDIIDENYTFSPKDDSMPIYNGLASLGLVVMNNYKIKKDNFSR